MEGWHIRSPPETFSPKLDHFLWIKTFETWTNCWGDDQVIIPSRGPWKSVRWVCHHFFEKNGINFLRNLEDDKPYYKQSRWWFQMIFVFTPTWGNDPIWLFSSPTTINSGCDSLEHLPTFPIKKWWLKKKHNFQQGGELGSWSQAPWILQQMTIQVIHWSKKAPANRHHRIMVPPNHPF